jgi:hypothetical protein
VPTKIRILSCTHTSFKINVPHTNDSHPKLWEPLLYTHFYFLRSWLNRPAWIKLYFSKYKTAPLSVCCWISLQSRPWGVMQVSCQSHTPLDCIAAYQVGGWMGLRSSLCKVIKLCSVTFNMFILSLLEFPSFISHTFHYMCARMVKMGTVRFVLPLINLWKTQI